MDWQSQRSIRARRELLGLSQAEVARKIGITKSLLCRIEAGERQPTEDQIVNLARVLQLPPDLLCLSSGRLPKDVQQVLAGSAAEGIRAVRERVEAHPVKYPDKPRRALVQCPDPFALCTNEQLPERIDVEKTSTSYRAHSYHTKVPPTAITPFIRAYSRPGDLVFDPFCGSGMTGVAALTENRNVLLSDISPASVHISRNYTTPCDSDALTAVLKRVEKIVNPTISWLYKPVGSNSLVEYTTWTDIFRCQTCQSSIRFWDSMQSGEIDGDRIRCASCKRLVRKADLQWIGEAPVLSHTSSGSSRIDTHPPTAHELALISEADSAPIPYWIPAVPFGPEREMWRAAHRGMGIVDVSGFFSHRNLHALAALRHAILASSEGRLREALLFAFTACLNRASRRYQWNAKRPTNVMTGTLYISSLRYEWNVWSLFRRKATDVIRYYQQFPSTKAWAEVFQRSATELDCLPDRSVDFVFMDPPFGSNIFYADSSLLWEAWLGLLTDERAEIVVNRHRSPHTGGKTVDDYGTLISSALAHIARILRKDARAVLAFSNSDDEVWTALRNGIRDSGFDIERTHILNKGQPSIKGVKGISGREHVTCLDLLLSLRHRAGAVQIAMPFSAPQIVIDEAIRTFLEVRDARTDEIYSEVLRVAMERGYSSAGLTMPMVIARCEGLGAHQINGRWSFESREASAGKDFLSGYLRSSGELPRSQSENRSSPPFSAVRVAGGRNSALYLAHSYHTKVPPEAIIPFIEHYTKPNDVILDPFCGSGMTGVAAALTGRRAILNDLSPAAIHLSWNHTRPCEPGALGESFAVLDHKLKEIFADIYRTVHKDGSEGTISWTIWSTEHRCFKCARLFSLWDAVDKESGRLGNTVSCPHCGKTLQRSRLDTLTSKPAWISYRLANGRRFGKKASAVDINRALNFRRDPSVWYPTTAIASDREMYIRCALKLQGVCSVADFYTPRNLLALSLLWREIRAVADERLRNALAFAFTNTAWHGTRMRRFNARGGQRPLTGTLYIPQLSSEVNVLEVMRHKIRQLQNYYATYRPMSSEMPALLLGTATNLSRVPTASVDYVFTDPPFGSNIFYADCNLIWESWLGRLTDVTEEAVVNRSLDVAHGGKSLSNYATRLKASMQEISRVLKPGGWATIVFHNTDAAVWHAIRDAAVAAGFEFHEASSLDRQQKSHKGYKGRTGAEDVAHFDVVFNLRNSVRHQAVPLSRVDKDAAQNEFDLKAIITAIVSDESVAEHGLQGVHAEVMRRLASITNTEFPDYATVRSIWEGIAGATQRYQTAASGVRKEECQILE